MTDYFIEDQRWSDVPPASLYVREVGYMSALKDEGVKIPPIKYVQETELLRARLRASAATEMLIYLLEGGEPDWKSWNDRSESLCGYFKERFTETVPELQGKLKDMLVSEVDPAHLRIVKLMNENDDLRNELLRARRRIDELESEGMTGELYPEDFAKRSDMIEKLGAMTAENSKLRAKAEADSRRIRTMEDELSTILRQKSELRMKLTDAVTENATLKCRNEELEFEIDFEKKENESLEANCDALVQRIREQGKPDIPVELEVERDYWKHQTELCLGYVTADQALKFHPDILSYPRTYEQITPAEVVRAWMESHRTLTMAEGE